MRTLKEHVTQIIDDNTDTQTRAEWLQDLFRGGCESGIVGELVYTKDCEKFLNEHRQEINELLAVAMEESGNMPFGDKWDCADPLGIAGNVSLLAWFGFEQTAYEIASDEGIEI